MSPLECTSHEAPSRTYAIPIHPNEKERLRTLRSYDILDTSQESDFDELVSLAAAICGTPISLVSLVDKERQWFKAAVRACKFPPPDKLVHVGQTGDVFWVRDEGIEFDMTYLPRIFLPFERLVLDSEFSGTGIGLANVKRILERHRGKVWAESTPGQCATFFFTLR